MRALLPLSFPAEPLSKAELKSETFSCKVSEIRNKGSVHSMEVCTLGTAGVGWERFLHHLRALMSQGQDYDVQQADVPGSEPGS